MSQPPYAPGPPPPPAPYGPGAPPPGPHPQPDATILDALVPTNPLAAVACWTGIFSMLICGVGLVLGPIAVVTGILSLKKGTLVEQSGYGKATTKARSWIGIVTGALGTILSIVVIALRVFGRH